jgi:Gti1/Pac2 family transcription factor
MTSAHVVAYFTQDTLDRLRTIDDLPQLANLNVPPGKYRTARSVRPNKAHYQSFDLIPSTTGYLTSKPPRHLSHGPDNQMVVDDARSNRHGHNQITRPGGRSRALYNADDLAPLAYLQNIPPPRRHPLDEEALMSFSTELLR